MPLITKAKIKQYYHLTKPGIVYGNSMTAIAAFIFASQGSYDFSLFVSTVAGTALGIAGSCVLNNYLDRGIDSKMARTKNRELVQGQIGGQAALIFGISLLVAGLTILSVFANLLAAAVGFIGFVFYLFVYGFAKRNSTYGTLVGSISGATPPVIGYVSVTNNVDAAAVLLFLILVTWQMPHFYAISIFRLKEYKAAGIPVLPSVKGIKATKMSMFVFNVLFVLACVSLFVLGYTGYAYLVVMTAVGLFWLKQCADGFSAKNDDKWARKFFGTSLTVLLTFSFMISVTYYLP